MLQSDKQVAGFTGPRALRNGQRETLLTPLVKELGHFQQFVTGAAYGLDTAAAEVCYELWPDAQHTLVVPAAWHNRDVVQWAFEREFEIIMAPGKDTVRDAYMARNDMMVNLLTKLFAFPTTPERMRSGTWATIRRARRRGIPVHYTELYK